MKSLKVKSVLVAGFIAYIFGVSAFVGSFYVPFLPDPEVQANLVLSIAILPAAMLGARSYYRKGHSTNGFLLGAAMFFVAMILDALITVPLFIIPAGGNHIAFFTDPGFWIIGLEYVLAVAIYWRLTKAVNTQAAQRSFSDPNSL
ncbi:MAG: DUF5367 family protein [Bacteroidota bacterium]